MPDSVPKLTHAQLAMLFAPSRDGLVLLNAAGEIEYCNGAAGTILQATMESLLGRRFLDLIHEASADLAAGALRGRRARDNSYVDLWIHGGQPALITASFRPLTDTGQMVVSFRDVTEDRQMEQELRRTKDFLENLVQSTVDAIIATDVDGGVILFNSAAEGLLGYAASEVLGKKGFADFCLPDDWFEMRRRLHAGSFGGAGRLASMRQVLVHRDGDALPVKLSAATLYEGDNAVAVVYVVVDLRAQLQMEERLELAQQRLRQSERQAVAAELAGTAAHELNQPLTSILGYADLLQRQLGDDPQHAKPVLRIVQESERMADIVKKIGQITSYQTKPYVGGSLILDLDDDAGDDDSDADS